MTSAIRTPLIQTIVFDWNGTLLDDGDVVHACFNQVFAHYGHPAASLARFRDAYAFPFTKLLANYGFSQAEIASFGEEAKHIFYDAYGPQENSLPLRDGAEDLLRRAHAAGISCVILSNHIVDKIEAHLIRLGIQPLIDRVIAYADHAAQGKGITKGDMLKAYRDSRNDNAGTTLIVGDSAEETEIGHRLGLRTAGITGGCGSEAQMRAAQPDYLVHSLRDLLPILNQRAAA